MDIEKGIFLDPLITEKAVMSIERNNQITFIVDKRNGKKQIKNDVEDVFGVKVEKIRTSIRGQEKHAYVKLKKEFLAIDIATKLGII
ncbi:MAG TPA: 50S ribosomal protein L23 [Candidatus Nanoarchaeia archaeon]|nr:50S ribosomal protein L23 [Candidatus Nanoarchaeia archaeon]